ncbi:MAG TPA: response regulator, partial [Thermodesulfovibrionia bacterium]|nr:response regulator [Thermodesulfovibrionia bacterium]
VYAPINKMMFNMSILLGLSVIGVNIIAFFITKSITRPLIAMTGVSRRIQKGDLTARNAIQRPDELGYLARSFNSLADFMMSQIKVQQGAAAINETIATSLELKDFASLLLKKLYEITESHLCAYHVLSENEQTFEHAASIGVNVSLLEPFDGTNFEGEFGKALMTRKVTIIKDVGVDTLFTFKTFAGTAIPKEIITIPIVVDDRVMAMFSLASLKGYSEETLELLNRTWMIMNTAYAGLLVNEKTKKLAVALRENNLQLQTQSKELWIKSDELRLKTLKLEAQTEELEAQSEELKQQNTELEQQRIQVEEANRMKSEFLSTMSHELRTPLNAIIALSRVLIMKSSVKLSEEEKKYLEIIDRNGKRLLELINDILDLSKIEAGRIELKIKPFSLKLTIESITETLLPIAQHKGIELGVEILPDLPDIESDEERVHQILQNIMNNAIKFTVSGKVVVTAQRENEHVSIQFADTGIGIQDKDLPHIFEEFRQADSTPSRQYEGTGLGLAIANRAVKLLGGSICVRSAFGVGSTFTVILPVKWHTPKEVTRPDRGILKPLSSDGNRIVLVEDNEAAIIQIKTLLEKQGYEVETACGGHEAIEILNHTVPDGIILDLMMPEVDGFEVLKAVRTGNAARNVPVLVLTAKDLTSEDIARLQQYNVQHYVQKGDIDPEGLLAQLAHLLRQPIQDKTNNLHDPAVSKRRKEKPAILIVEDNQDNLATFRAILGARYTLLEAVDGKQGLKTAIESLPDLIILDIALPSMDGYSVIESLKQNERSCLIPVIAVTAHAMKGDRERILNRGCSDYIAKPVDPKELVAVIEKWLDHPQPLKHNVKGVQNDKNPGN